MYNSSNQLVTIGLPVYNGAEYLEESIRSLLNQSYMNFELIISDNCSDDRTNEICEKFKEIDKRIIYFRQPTNIGAFRNFQFILEMAKGNYFMFAAYDDLWDKDFISKLVELLESNPKSALAICSIVGIDEFGNKIWDCPWTSKLQSKCKLIRLVKFIIQNDYQKKPILIYGLHRKFNFDRAGGFRKWSEYDFARTLHVVFSVLITGDLLVAKDVTFYKRKTGVKHYPNERLKENLRTKGIIGEKFELIAIKLRNSFSHNFVKYLDGYLNVAKESSFLRSFERYFLFIFLSLWKKYLILKIFMKY